MKAKKKFKVNYIEDGKTCNVIANGRNAAEMYSVFSRVYPKAKVVSVERVV